MRVEELGLTFGDMLQVQIGDDVDQRYPVKLIGLNPVGSIIISAPMTGKDKMFFVREGINVTLRFVVKNVVSGFSTRVMYTRGHPYPYLHLEIPKEIQTVEVRKEVRISTHINTTIINKTHDSPALTGAVLNLSCAGALVESNSKLALMDNILIVTMPIVFDGIERIISLDCHVNYVKEFEETHKFTYGVNFQNIDDEDNLILRSFIYQELLIENHLI